MLIYKFLLEDSNIVALFFQIFESIPLDYECLYTPDEYQLSFYLNFH